ncbi:thermonuclease family protein [Pseudonocardia sp. CA-142604]|uniref:thermonuclease family protein n=1 Tax=Pseudonocardia sp. CA-142604 TaxID=3240024 RepID=UPI003D93FF11
MARKNNAAAGCLWLLGLFVVVAACNGITGGGDAEETTTAQAQKSPIELLDERCHNDDIVYEADRTCFKGGELVTVKRAVDGDTVELADGRLVRLFGFDAPEPDQCAGPGATEYVRGQVEGRQVKIIAESGVDKVKDEFLRYIQYPDPASVLESPLFTEDLGRNVVSTGWAKVYENGANSKYQKAITFSAEYAPYHPEGMYAPPCGKPKVYGDDDGNGTADWEEHVSVNGPNVNLPDGALTGGFCAHRRWC